MMLSAISGAHDDRPMHRPAARAPIWPLDWEPLYAEGAALKKKKKEKKKEKKTKKRKERSINQLSRLSTLTAQKKTNIILRKTSKTENLRELDKYIINGGKTNQKLFSVLAITR